MVETQMAMAPGQGQPALYPFRESYSCRHLETAAEAFWLRAVQMEQAWVRVSKWVLAVARRDAV
jgi:hypothetical protein